MTIDRSGSAVPRTRLANLALVGMAISAATAADDIPLAILDFLDGAICSASAVESVVRDAERVRLTISVGAGTAAGLEALDDAARADWLALHCPPAPTLRRLAPDVSDLVVDTLIDGDLPMSGGSLSCRTHEERSDARRAAARAVALERLAGRLDRPASQNDRARDR